MKETLSTSGTKYEGKNEKKKKNTANQMNSLTSRQ